MLPYEVEAAFGIVKPRFTWDYGTELFWEEKIHGGKFSCNDYLGAMHETGIELYKPIELSGVSLPTYFYLLNGGPGGQKNLCRRSGCASTVDDDKLLHKFWFLQGYVADNPPPLRLAY